MTESNEKSAESNERLNSLFAIMARDLLAKTRPVWPQLTERQETLLEDLATWLWRGGNMDTWLPVMAEKVILVELAGEAREEVIRRYGFDQGSQLERGVGEYGLVYGRRIAHHLRVWGHQAFPDNVFYVVFQPIYPSTRQDLEIAFDRRLIRHYLVTILPAKEGELGSVTSVSYPVPPIPQEPPPPFQEYLRDTRVDPRHREEEQDRRERKGRIWSRKWELD